MVTMFFALETGSYGPRSLTVAASMSVSASRAGCSVGRMMSKLPFVLFRRLPTKASSVACGGTGDSYVAGPFSVNGLFRPAAIPGLCLHHPITLTRISIMAPNPCSHPDAPGIGDPLRNSGDGRQAGPKAAKAQPPHRRRKVFRPPDYAPSPHNTAIDPAASHRPR